MEKRKKLTLTAILVIVVAVVVDQIIKILVRTHMAPGETIPVLGNWFLLHFVENEGIAFGVSFGQNIGKLLLSLFRIGLSGLLIWWIGKMLKRERPVPTGVLIGLTLIAAGAVGNLIDCLFYGMVFSESTVDAVSAFGGSYAPFMQGRVVDMFYFPLWTWPEWVPFVGGDIFFRPVFNFADSCITCGVITLLLFYAKVVNMGLHYNNPEDSGTTDEADEKE